MLIEHSFKYSNLVMQRLTNEYDLLSISFLEMNKNKYMNEKHILGKSLLFQDDHTHPERHAREKGN